MSPLSIVVVAMTGAIKVKQSLVVISHFSMTWTEYPYKTLQEGTARPCKKDSCLIFFSSILISKADADLLKKTPIKAGCPSPVQLRPWHSCKKSYVWLSENVGCPIKSQLKICKWDRCQLTHILSIWQWRQKDNHMSTCIGFYEQAKNVQTSCPQ